MTGLTDPRTIAIIALSLAITATVAWTLHQWAIDQRQRLQATPQRRHLPAAPPLNHAQRTAYQGHKLHQATQANHRLAQALEEALAENHRLRLALYGLDDQARRRLPRDDDCDRLAYELGAISTTELHQIGAAA